MHALSVCEQAERGEERVPIAVELDGTLVRTDIVLESLFVLAKRRPLEIFKVPFWLARGRAHLKRRLGQEAIPDIHTLPYRRILLAHLEAENRQGRPLVLVSSCDESVARAVAEELTIFQATVASDGATNIGGRRIRHSLVEPFGEKGFDYVCGRRRGRPVWSAARKLILVQPTATASRSAASASHVDRVFEDGAGRPRAYVRALRPPHWLKNVLVFVPLAAAHKLHELAPVKQTVLAFVALSLCASSVYLFNDLLDIPADRRHPHKRERPIASGQVPIGLAAGSIPILLACAIAVARPVSSSFMAVLGAYCALMLAYCLWLKDLPLIDVLALAAGYALRVVAGATAVRLELSPLLLAYCVFFFLSLALLKRYAELVMLRPLMGAGTRARAYIATDVELMLPAGIASGYLGVLVLLFHVATEQEPQGRQALLWLVCALLLVWITYMWLMAHRGRVRGDPVAFALKDRVSQVLAALIAGALLVAS